MPAMPDAMPVENGLMIEERQPIWVPRTTIMIAVTVSRPRARMTGTNIRK
jgi:hypothetical protein